MVPFLSSDIICSQSAGHFLLGLGVLLVVILEHQCINNGDMYCVTLKFFKEAIRRKRPCLSSVAVLHDNAQPHPHTVQQTLSLVLKIWTIFHTVWLWHLAICILFPASEEQLSEHHFTCNEDVKPTTITQLTCDLCVQDTQIYHIL